jgi:uncharacterized RDD family membrane protein YckC
MLPPVGECNACAVTLRDTPVPSLLDRDIRIDRRTSDRPSAAPSQPEAPAFVAAAHAPPSVAPLAAPLPPPAAPRAAAPQPGHPGVAAPRMPAPQPGGAAPRAARAPPPPPGAAPRAAPRQAPAAQPPRAAQPPAPGSPMTPAYGTPPAAPAPRAQVQPPAPMPGVAAPASAPAGLPRMEGPASMSAPVTAAGLPRMEAAATVSASPAPSGLPRMESVPPAPAAVARPEVSKGPTPAARAQAPSGVAEVRARPASLWRRLLSFSIDTAAIAGVAALYITLASSVTGVKAPQAGLSGLDGFVAWLRALHSVLLPGFFLVLVLALVYCAVAAFLWNGRTLGRLLLGLRLVDTHGLAPAPGRAIVRAMLASVSFLFFLGGFWMALFDRRGQTLHDKLTSTFVVQPS